MPAPNLARPNYTERCGTCITCAAVVFEPEKEFAFTGLYFCTKGSPKPEWPKPMCYVVYPGDPDPTKGYGARLDQVRVWREENEVKPWGWCSNFEEKVK